MSELLFSKVADSVAALDMREYGFSLTRTRKMYSRVFFAVSVT